MAQDHFDPAPDFLASENLVVVACVLVGEVGGDEVVVGASDDATGVGEAVGEVHDAAGVHVHAVCVFNEEACVCECIEETQAGLRAHFAEELTD